MTELHLPWLSLPPVNYTDPNADVPTRVDFRNPDHAQAWFLQSEVEKPWRTPMRLRFAELVEQLPADSTILELGSGPGLLAECILERCLNVSSYTLLDFSDAMLDMSRERLARFPSARFVNGDFKLEGWTADLKAPFTAVLAMQAVHEVRHKRHVPGLYRQLREMLLPGGSLMVCDGTPKDSSLFATSLHMTAEEQLAAFTGAGLIDVALDKTVEPIVLVTGRILAYSTVQSR